MVEVSGHEGNVTVLTGVMVEVSGHEVSVTVLTGAMSGHEGSVIQVRLVVVVESSLFHSKASVDKLWLSFLSFPIQASQFIQILAYRKRIELYLSSYGSNILLPYT